MGMDDGDRFLQNYGSDEYSEYSFDEDSDCDSLQGNFTDSDLEVSVEDKLRAKLLRKPTHEEIAAFKKRRRKERRRRRSVQRERSWGRGRGEKLLPWWCV